MYNIKTNRNINYKFILDICFMDSNLVCTLEHFAHCECIRHLLVFMPKEIMLLM